MNFPAKILRTALIIASAMVEGGLWANNINVTSVALSGNTGTTVNVQFNISWENSWRSNNTPNHDAAWVFVKYRLSNGLWQHAQLNNTGHTAPSGSLIETGLLTPGTAFNANTNPVIGVFIRRSANGTGTFTANGVQLAWNYSLAGVAFADISEVRVFAIEMVQVPEGAFFVGSGGTEDFSFTNGSWTSGNTIPLQITSEGAITIGQAAGNLWGTSSSGSNTIGPAGTLPAAFPKGFGAFYCMKYEITQQQYVDFLNTLTRIQQNSRTETDLSVGVTTVTDRFVMSETSTTFIGNGIRCDASIDANAPIAFYCDLNGNGTGGESADGQWIACNWLGWTDLAAYLDWSGLRPMTELEFEKACRGTLPPVPNDFPWGTATVVSGEYFYSNPGAANEGIATNYSTTLGNASYVDTDGIRPRRVGIFAANASNSGRVSSGASYYGIMELGGNIRELPVTVGNTAGNTVGRSFTGLHGNGVLATNGGPDVANWPPATGFRGGGFSSPGSDMRVSDRFAAGALESGRTEVYGGRGVRVVP